MVGVWGFLGIVALIFGLLCAGIALWAAISALAHLGQGIEDREE